MSDLYEQILDGLFAAIDQSDVHNALDITSATIFRNRGYASSLQRPAIVQLDGDEELVSVAAARSARGDVAPAGQIMRIRPQVYALLKARKLDDAELYAAEIAKYRRVIVSTVLFDPGVRELVGTNGKVRYVRMETDMKVGSGMEGEIFFEFALEYFLDPSQIIVS